MKKLISLALALVLILSLSTVAFAADTVDWTKNTKPTIMKNYKVTGGTAPTESFTFHFTYTDFKSPDTSLNKNNVSGPDLTLGAAMSFDNEGGYTADSNKTVNIVTVTDGSADDVLNLSEFPKLGNYYYEVKEDIPTSQTQGTDYSTTTKYLCIKVYLNDEGDRTCDFTYYTDDKYGTKTNNEFDNTYNAQKLTISKTVAGSLGEATKKFQFTVEFTAEIGKTWNNNVTVTTTGSPVITGEGMGWTGNTYVAKLGNGDSIEFTNLPEGVTYTVTEDPESYTSSLDDNTTTGKIGEDDVTVAVTNTLSDSNPGTGIVLDSMPYILLLTLAAVGMFVLLTKKRAREY